MKRGQRQGLENLHEKRVEGRVWDDTQHLAWKSVVFFKTEEAGDLGLRLLEHTQVEISSRHWAQRTETQGWESI